LGYCLKLDVSAPILSKIKRDNSASRVVVSAMSFLREYHAHLLFFSAQRKNRKCI